ncbi:hypothetical protein [Niabella aurantiaca]|uniref:hypothetical protein n=1 Tax=Niabella aurantiaca TaxID=379900 RepID=UPI0003620530|nr:hypothetical protein [Niabella aurantiaca]
MYDSATSLEIPVSFYIALILSLTISLVIAHVIIKSAIESALKPSIEQISSEITRLITTVRAIALKKGINNADLDEYFIDHESFNRAVSKIRHYEQLVAEISLPENKETYERKIAELKITLDNLASKI